MIILMKQIENLIHWHLVLKHYYKNKSNKYFFDIFNKLDCTKGGIQENWKTTIMGIRTQNLRLTSSLFIESYKERSNLRRETRNY